MALRKQINEIMKNFTIKKGSINSVNWLQVDKTISNTVALLYPGKKFSFVDEEKVKGCGHRSLKRKMIFESGTVLFIDIVPVTKVLIGKQAKKDDKLRNLFVDLTFTIFEKN